MEAPDSQYRRVSRRKPRRKGTVIVGAVLAGIVIISTLLVGTGAVFTSTSSNPANVFTAGILKHTNGKDGAAILTATKMKPGDSVSGAVTIANDGDLAGVFSLATSNMTDTAGANGGKLSDVLKVKIVDQTTSATLYDGTIKSVGTIAAGTFPAAATHTYQFTVSFPEGGTPANNTSGDNAYKGSSMSIQFDWSEVQS
jgi:spore coat-associated protein N